MDEAGVRDVVLARALEEVDREGRLAPLRARAAASREARAKEGGAGDDADGRERFLLARARLLVAPLVTEHAGFARVRALAGRMAVPGWLAFVLALALGFGVDQLARGEVVNVLSFPILGLLAWNLAAYLFFALTALGRAGSRSARAAQSGWLARAMGWLASPQRRWTRLRGVEEAGLIARVCERFLADWSRAGAPLHLARGRFALHCGAAALALGVVAGMYLRGLAVDYRASWESTFLDAEGAHALLAFVLTPAARVLGTEVPGVEVLRGMRAASEPPSAAIWIHLYGTSALLLVVLPRLALAWGARRSARRLAARLPIRWDQDPYFLRLFALDRGSGARAEVLPYSHHLEARAAEELQALLLDLLGNRARIELRPSLEYGADPPPPAHAEEGPVATCRVLVFNLGQSPEQEVHGEHLAHVQREVRAEGELSQLLVVVDESRYAARLGRGEEARERLESRRRAWQRVFRELDLRALFLELDGSLKPEALGEAQAALWPARGSGALAAGAPA